MSVAYDRVLLLLSIVEKSLQHPKLRPIVNAATAELEALNQDCSDWLEEKATKDKEAKAAADEEAAIEAAALAEKDAKDHPDQKPKVIPAEENDKPAVQRRI